MCFCQGILAKRRITYRIHHHHHHRHRRRRRRRHRHRHHHHHHHHHHHYHHHHLITSVSQNKAVMYVFVNLPFMSSHEVSI